MIDVRRSEDRGHFDHGWLDTRHTFSFADYYDPKFMGFRALRVINEDRVQADAGFPTHSHRDMEILTCVLEGALEHKDSMGNGTVIKPGEVQRMSAGTGVRHSEYNSSRDQPVHFLQIWIEPDARGVAPGYEQQSFPADERRNRFRRVASRDGKDGSVSLHQDVDLNWCVLDAGRELTIELRPGRHAWLQMIAGELQLGAVPLQSGDGAALSDERKVQVRAIAPSELLWFDLA